MRMTGTLTPSERIVGSQYVGTRSNELGLSIESERSHYETRSLSAHAKRAWTELFSTERTDDRDDVRFSNLVDEVASVFGSSCKGTPASGEAISRHTRRAREQRLERCRGPTQSHLREESMMTVVTLWPGVTAGGMVTSGRTVRGARRTNDSLRAGESVEERVDEAGEYETTNKSQRAPVPAVGASTVVNASAHVLDQGRDDGALADALIADEADPHVPHRSSFRRSACVRAEANSRVAADWSRS